MTCGGSPAKRRTPLIYVKIETFREASPLKRRFILILYA
jgi:hypothetical protein